MGILIYPRCKQSWKTWANFLSRIHVKMTLHKIFYRLPIFGFQNRLFPLGEIS